jgi:hypothetical protein
MFGRRAQDSFVDYLTVAQDATLLGVSTDTLRSWGNKGKLTAVGQAINGYRLNRPDDLHGLLEFVRGGFSATPPIGRKQRATGFSAIQR